MSEKQPAKARVRPPEAPEEPLASLLGAAVDALEALSALLASKPINTVTRDQAEKAAGALVNIQNHSQSQDNPKVQCCIGIALAETDKICYLSPADPSKPNVGSARVIRECADDLHSLASGLPDLLQKLEAHSHTLAYALIEAILQSETIKFDRATTKQFWTGKHRPDVHDIKNICASANKLLALTQQPWRIRKLRNELAVHRVQKI